MISARKAIIEAPMQILAAPRTFSLNFFIINPPVMIPKATAGRFIMPEKMI